MRITTLLLCDFAQVRESLLFVSSGGLTRVWRPALPSQLDARLAVVVEVEPHEAADAHEVRVTVAHAGTAQQVATATLAFQLERVGNEPGESIQVPAVIDLRTVPLHHEGVYDIRVSTDGSEAPGIVTFFVGLRPVGPR